MTRKVSVGAAVLLVLGSLGLAATAVTSSHDRKETSNAMLVSAALTSSSDPSRVGRWSKPRQTPLISVHATVLHTGEVLLFSYFERGRRAYVWNPENGKFRPVPLGNQIDIFCSGHTVLPDGRVLVAGGHKHQKGREKDDISAGITAALVFDPVTERWTRVQNMKTARWYPTLTTLPDGNAAAMAGFNSKGKITRRVEIYDPVRNSWKLVRKASRDLGLYPHQHVLADGRLVVASTGGESSSLDLKTWRWLQGPEHQDPESWDKSTVLLDGARKVLAFGGISDDEAPASRSAEILDTGASDPSWNTTGHLNYGRKNADSVLLADGTVLTVGGNRRGEKSAPVKVAELYDPQTGLWRNMATQRVRRTEHSTAVLLPDGRVLSAGSDPIFNYEVFSPPYLFKGKRPVVDLIGSTVRYDSRMTISSSNASTINRLALVRPGSVTHSVNMEQRYLSVNFTRKGNRLIADTPANANLAPPGYYMLFAISNNGVPSKARFVLLDND